jgi:hypothetical protein
MILWAMHMPSKLWHIMMYWYFVPSFIKGTISLNPIKALVVDRPTIIENDDFFWADYIKWWCNHVHLKIQIKIISMICYVTAENWKPFNLMVKTCCPSSPCFIPCLSSTWHYGIIDWNRTFF